MKTMKRAALAAAAIMGVASAGALAQQPAEPTYKGDPSVYKLIFEDANFRVIEVNRPKGVHDKVHGHPSPGVVYHITDCKTKIYAADGKTNVTDRKAGTAGSVPVISAHTAENIGDSDCKQVFVEKK